MRGALTLVLFAAGCSQFFGLDRPVPVDARGVGDIGEGGGDSATADARTCFGSGAFAVCLQAPPAQPVALTSGAALDTTTSTLCASSSGWVDVSQPAACFVVGTTITIGDLRVTGSRPLVFVASNDITVTGKLDAAAHGTSAGPGAPSGFCATYVVVPQNSANGGGGGAGASFMSRGGNGGTGDNGFTTAGLAPAVDSLAPGALRAGCAGQRGGDGGTAGSGGRAGGAVYLVAGNSITLGPAAIINASGAGAGGSASKAGGGGGGSGGMIVLYAPSINASSGAKLAANGGGGSAGASNGTGAAGNDPDPTNPLSAATGGIGGGGAASGGDGFAVGSPAADGQTGSSSDGGGGGGGGAGYIRANVAIGSAVASPTPAIVP